MITVTRSRYPHNLEGGMKLKKTVTKEPPPQAAAAAAAAAAVAVAVAAGTR